MPRCIESRCAYHREALRKTGAKLESRGSKMKNRITTQVVQHLETISENLQRQVLDIILALQLLAQRGVSGKLLEPCLAVTVRVEGCLQATKRRRAVFQYLSTPL